MKKSLILTTALLFSATLSAAEFSETVKGVAPADVTVSCSELGSWKFNIKGTKPAEEIGEVIVTIPPFRLNSL